jgi:hypothetical protein
MDEPNSNHQLPEVNFPKLQRRRSLLPWWVITFIWLFLLLFLAMPIAIVLGLLNYSFELSLLGVTTNQPISLIGMFLMLLFSFKGVTAYALWTEKIWAVGLAKIDAVISIILCFLVMAYAIFYNHSFNIRLELVALFPYYYKMNTIQYDWENFDSLEYPEYTDPVMP